MTTTPLPEPMWPQSGRDRPYEDAYSAANMQAYAAASRADLEAEVKRLRDFVRKYVKWVEEENHPTEGTTFWDRIEMCRELDALAREALKETP